MLQHSGGYQDCKRLHQARKFQKTLSFCNTFYKGPDFTVSQQHTCLVTSLYLYLLHTEIVQSNQIAERTITY